MAAKRSWLANVVWAAHLGVVVLVLVGWALPWRWALWAVAGLAAAVQASWWFCDDRCPLTVLEERLRGDAAAPRVALPEDAARPGNFLADLATAALGRPLPHRWINAAAYLAIWFAFAAALVRLATDSEV